MKILAIADRRPSRPIKDILAEQKIDVIVTLGDLELSDIRYLELVTDIPKLGVYGNHCSGMYMPEVGIKNMHMQTTTIDNLVFGGFEGCVKYKESSAKMYTQDEASAMLAIMTKVDVMLTHCPPYGINDDLTDIAHTGYVGLRKYVERERPKYLFHGHTYPTDATMVYRLGETEIIYVYGEKVIEISNLLA